MRKRNYSNPDITSESGRENTARDYEYLMRRIINQWDGRCPLDRDLITMYVHYGLVYAMNHYREGTTQTFPQYAAWCMKNWVLNGISESGSTVRMNSSQRNKLRDQGESVYNTISIDRNDTPDHDTELGKYLSESLYEIDCEVADHDKSFKMLFKFVNKNFDKRTRDIFYHTYKLNGRKLMKGCELAQKYGVSTALISQSNRHVLDKIRSNKKLCEILDAFR